MPDEGAGDKEYDVCVHFCECVCERERQRGVFTNNCIYYN